MYYIYIDSFSIKTPIYGGFPIATFDYKQPVIAKAGWGQSHQQGKETAQRPKPGPLSHPELVVFAMETNLVGGFIIYIIIYWLVVYPPSEKYEFVSWDDDIPNIWKFI